MVDSMEVDEEPVAVKEEPISNSEEEVKKSNVHKDFNTITLDKVSLLQESVDKMALSMFNALRLLPAKLNPAEGEEQDPLQVIKDLASDVLQVVKETDVLIDDLPGLEKSESDQLEELRLLQIRSEEEAQTLRQVAEEAETWMERARDSLRVISETRLRQA